MNETRNPPEQILWRLEGDKDRADALRGLGLQLKAQMQRENVNDYAVYSQNYRGKDGTACTVERNRGPLVDTYTITIYCPPRRQARPESAETSIPALQPGQFFYVPGCVARYGFRKGRELYNEIPLPSAYFGDADTTNEGNNIEFLSIKEAGLPPSGTSPDGSIARIYRICKLEAADQDSNDGGGQLLLSSALIPSRDAFSISFVVRLKEPIRYDYSFSSMTSAVGNGYTIYNPIKPRLLLSDDGNDFYSICPGSIAPLVGYKLPSRFSDHYVRLTYPWPTFNDNFTASEESLLGYREIGTACPDEPSLTSEYSITSPYWDKVVTGGLETLDGEFVAGWEENAEIQNTAPYASYCTFKVNGEHGKGIGSRAVGTLSDGSHRYSTVHAISREYNPDGSTKSTTLTLKDYQYKLHMTDAAPSIAFGSQPFPVCHPAGYLIGMNLIGLCWYNGNRIVAGKVCDFQSEYEFPPIISDELDLESWYHVCMTYKENGNTFLYISKKDSRNITYSNKLQSTETFQKTDGQGNPLKINVGSDYFMFASDSEGTNTTSEWFSTSAMDIGLLRFYRHALTKAEAQLLTQEVFDGVFVADDHEAAQLQGKGLQAVTV
uniref:Uncharacterized protein n=1 Tax=Desulfovibrio sp. U5L TaxID=596152 RepID=I2Q1D6_9BACT